MKNTQKRTGNWLGRSLDNFKDRNRSKAQELGVLDQLLTAKTLTKARKIMRGKND